MNDTTNFAPRGAPGRRRGVLAAALLGAALVSVHAQAERPKLQLVFVPAGPDADTAVVTEGRRIAAQIEADGSISASAAQCEVIVDLSNDTAEDGDYRLATGSYTIQLVGGTDTKSHGFEVEALQDADHDDETIDVTASVECPAHVVPPPQDEMPTDPDDMTLAISDDDVD